MCRVVEFISRHVAVLNFELTVNGLVSTCPFFVQVHEHLSTHVPGLEVILLDCLDEQQKWAEAVKVRRSNYLQIPSLVQ